MSGGSGSSRSGSGSSRSGGWSKQRGDWRQGDDTWRRGRAVTDRAGGRGWPLEDGPVGPPPPWVVDAAEEAGGEPSAPAWVTDATPEGGASSAAAGAMGSASGDGESSGLASATEAAPEGGEPSEPRWASAVESESGSASDYSGRGGRAPKGARGRRAARGFGAAAPADARVPAPAETGESAARRIALDALSRSARTRGQLEALLQRKEIEPEAAAVVLDRFEELGLIDDVGYAEAFVESRHRVRGQGVRALSAELRRRGVADDVVTEAVGALDPDVEFETACRLARSRLSRMSGLAPEVKVRRLAGFLARKGYSGAIVARAIRHAVDASAAEVEAAESLDGFDADADDADIDVDE